jgi:nucleotide-binding universal stress UspA family protein
LTMNPNRILAAVDFSDRSRIALGFAARLACQFDAELHVMHAQDPLLSAAAESRGLNLASDTENELRAFVGDTWPCQQCRLHFDVIVGSAAISIAHAAEREGPDVIVMAAHGMSGAQHVLLGSTTEGVLRRSNVSVLVIPDDWSPADASAMDLRGQGPVIVGIDFRIPSFEAAADAASLARALGTELILVHVVPALRVLPQWREHANAALVQRAAKAQQELEQLRERISSGIPARALVTRGRAATCLGEAAKPYAHGIVAVGRTVHPHGYAPPGTTAYRVLTGAHLPVLMHVAR